MSQIGPELWTLYLGYLLLPVIAAGTLPMTWTRAVIGWFVASRGIALGLSLVGTGVVGALLPSYISWLIVEVGWRNAYLGIAAVPLVIGMPLALLYFREPEERLPADAIVRDVTSSAADSGSYGFDDAVRTVSFWQLSLSFLLAAICVGAVLTHSIPLLLDRGMAAPVLGGAAACAVLVTAGESRLLCAVAIMLVGLAAGAEADIGAYVAAKYFGRVHYGAIYGLFYTIYCLGGGIGPLLAGFAYDNSGSYTTSLYVGVLGFAVAAIAAGLLKPPRARRP
jgi:sugar phosphate permease